MKRNEENKKQYSTTKNLEGRINLHKYHSTNKIGWTHWVFDQLNLKDDLKVLELGAGTGKLWLDQSHLPNIDLVCSDHSPAMVEKLEMSVKDIFETVSFQTINAEAIPFPDESFDVVIANHMIYHIPDIETALKEMKRVLKPGGQLKTSTIGKNNMKELHKLLEEFNADITFTSDDITKRFNLENGQSLLKDHFPNVEIKYYEDAIVLENIQPLIDYLMTLDGLGNVVTVLSKDMTNFKKYLNEIMHSKGQLRIEKSVGLLTSVK